MRIEKRSLATLRTAKYNPRRISEDAAARLEASVKRFGLVEPIVVNDRTGTVVGGHQRLKILKKMGEVECEVVLVDLAPKEERALNLVLNSRAHQGEFTADLDALVAGVRDEAEGRSLADEVGLDAILASFRVSAEGASRVEPDSEGAAKKRDFSVSAEELDEFSGEPPKKMSWVVIQAFSGEAALIVEGLRRHNLLSPGCRVEVSDVSGTAGDDGSDDGDR